MFECKSCIAATVWVHLGSCLRFAYTYRYVSFDAGEWTSVGECGSLLYLLPTASLFSVLINIFIKPIISHQKFCEDNCWVILSILDTKWSLEIMITEIFLYCLEGIVRKDQITGHFLPGYPSEQAARFH